MNFFPVFRNRCLATSAKPKAAEKPEKAVTANQSFVQNFFLGKVRSGETFPYPYYLTEEESETLSMVVDPVKRFFAVSRKLWQSKMQMEFIEMKIMLKMLFFCSAGNKRPIQE